jgi:hypothetical protein
MLGAVNVMNESDDKAGKTVKKSQAEDSRRKLLKAAAAGGGVAVGLKALPEAWRKPVIDVVVLPAHAQVSGDLSDPCSAVIIPLTTLTWNVQVTGTVLGIGGAGITVDATGTHGSETQNGSDTTDSSGAYSIVLGPFSCAGGGMGQVNVTVTSPHPLLEGDSASCPANTLKCAAAGP